MNLIIPQSPSPVKDLQYWRFVYASLSSKALGNGLLGHCLFIESDEFRPLGEMRNESLPERCVATAKAMADRERRFNETSILEPIVVTESPEARLKIAELRTGSDAIARRLFESDLRTAALKPINIASTTKWNIDTNIQTRPYEVNDEIAAAGTRTLTATGYFPVINTSAADEGVWFEDDQGRRILGGQVQFSEFGHLTYHITETLKPDQYWLTLSGRYCDDPALIRVHRRITVR